MRLIERSMAPLLGTVSGLGTWFSLSLRARSHSSVACRTSFSLRPADPPGCNHARAVLILVNILGAEQTGRLQIGIVAVMLAAIGWFVAGGGPAVDTATYGGMWEYGVDGSSPRPASCSSPSPA